MQRKIKEVEAVQRRAARSVVGDSSYTSSASQMIEDPGLQSLQSRRSNAKLVMVYRITDTQAASSCILPQSTQEVTASFTRCNTAVQTPTATPFFHLVFACGINCGDLVTAPFLQPLRKVHRGRLSTKLLLFLSTFKSVHTVPHEDL